MQTSIDEIFEDIHDAYELTQERLGARRNRLCKIADIPQKPRDLFLVLDVLLITCQSGLGAWIYYHHDEDGWIDAAKAAFIRLGHPKAAEDLEAGQKLFLEDPKWEQNEQWHALDDYLIDHENQIATDLHKILTECEVG